MTQSWNPTVYAEIGSFVPALGAGVLVWLAPQSGERILDLGCGDGQLTTRTRRNRRKSSRRGCFAGNDRERAREGN